MLFFLLFDGSMQPEGRAITQGSTISERQRSLAPLLLAYIFPDIQRHVFRSSIEHSNQSPYVHTHTHTQMDILYMDKAARIDLYQSARQRTRCDVPICTYGLREKVSIDMQVQKRNSDIYRRRHYRYRAFIRRQVFLHILFSIYWCVWMEKQ